MRTRDGKCTDDLFCLFHINIDHVEQVTASDQCWMSVVDVDTDIRS